MRKTLKKKKPVKKKSASAAQSKRDWKVLALKVTHSYVLLGTICALLLLGAVNWSTRQSSGDSKAFKPMGPPPLKNVSFEDPMSFFHPAWSSDKGFETLGLAQDSLDSFYAAATEARKYVEDPMARIEPDFQVPAELKRRVTFWMEIYSHYSSRTRVVHDRNDPSLVYGHIDFRPVYRQLGAGAATEARIASLEKKILKTLTAQLKEAAAITQTKLLAADEKVALQSFLSRFGASTPAAAAELIENLRTQTGQSDFFLQALYRSRELLPHIESVFKQHGLPAALARIPFVESSFNPNAKSAVGAVGIWQFMPETARELIHEEEESLWSDPLRQTKSAARMLKAYRTVLPDWSTTVTSYNSGVGRVRRIVEKRNLKNAYAFSSLPSDDGLGFAGKNFFSEFLAANLVEAYKTELFSKWLGAEDFDRIFAGTMPFPKDICSAL